MSGRGAVAFAVGLLAFLAAGLYLGGHPGSLPEPLREIFVAETGGLTTEAAEVLEDNYYRPVSNKQLSNASLQGMVRDLRRRNKEDHYTEYFSPEALEAFNQGIEGRFSGIGVTIEPVKAGMRIGKVFRHSPAGQAGIEAGDVIVSVEGESIAGKNPEQVGNKVRGPEGTQVRLGVRDRKSGKVSHLTITRAEVALPNVSSQVETVNGKKLGYIRMRSFSEGVDELLANAVRKVQKEGAEGIVLDLRENPGGLLQEAVLSAGVFLPEGEVVVSTKSRTQGDNVYKTKGGNLPQRPLVVLIDRNTASAAEILAAALADDSGAKVVGMRSYGKGLFQEEHSLANGGAIKLSVGEFFTPQGVNLAKSHGVHPDVKAVDNPATKVDEAKQRALGVLAAQIGS
ncbi:MAG: S41 family peptidase [Solirubrobacterales bacterium]